MEIAKGRSFDIIEIDGASNRGIDDIRRLTETVSYTPQTGQYKIYIIDEVHMLTKEAFNALLKTLEEPPENAKFFFATTEPHRVPPTIISRCQRFNLARIPVETIVEKLKRITDQLRIEIEEAALVQIGKLAEGSLRDAESLLDQLICFGQMPITEALTKDIFGLLSHDHLKEIDNAIENGDTNRAIDIGKMLYNSGRDVGACIDHLLEHYRDHLLTGKQFDKSQALNILETLIEWEQQLSKTPFKQVHLEMCLAALVKNARRLTIDTLIERLIQLEAGVPSKVTAPDNKQKTKAPVVEQALPKQPSAPDQFQQQKAKCHVAKQPNEAPITPKAQQEGPVVARPVKDPCKPTSEQQGSRSKQEHPASKYETLIRFAAVELEGSINNG
jgi:DNA polymerase-3 subunit gamma/tau